MSQEYSALDHIQRECDDADVSVLASRIYSELAGIKYFYAEHLTVAADIAEKHFALNGKRFFTTQVRTRAIDKVRHLLAGNGAIT